MSFLAMNSIKLLGICGMLLSQPKEITSHGLRLNNSPVSPVVMGLFFFSQRFGICILVLARDTD